MSSRKSATLGARKPRYHSGPPAVSSGAGEAAELAASAGLILDPWQVDVLDGALAERPDGRCAAFTVGLVVPRQNGKDAILEAAELYWLFLDPSVRLITHTCHRFDTALEHFERVRALIEETPDLHRQVRKISDTNGKESIRLRNGSRLNFKTRGVKGGGRGYSGDRVILNEALRLGKLGNLIPTMSARPDPQLWYVSSAPEEGPESDRLRALIRRGRRGDKTLVYFEWSANPDSRLDDPAAIAQANPSLGHRLSLDYVLDVERKEMTDDEFAVERLGIFDDGDDGVPPQIAAHDWKRCRTKRREPGPNWMADPVAFGVAVTPDREWASIGAAGSCVESGIAIEVVEHRPGTAWVLDRCKELDAKHRHVGFVIDPRGPAGTLITSLTDAGLTVTECNSSKRLLAAGGFYDDVRNHAVVHRSSTELDAAVAVAVARPVGDSWLFARTAPRKPDQHGDPVPISPLEAVELARWGHITLDEGDPADSVW